MTDTNPFAALLDGVPRRVIEDGGDALYHGKRTTYLPETEVLAALAALPAQSVEIERLKAIVVTQGQTMAERLTRAEAAETALAAMTKERDAALHFLDVAVDKSPEPLKKLGKHLASLLDEDDWPTAERFLNGAATALAAERAKTAKLVEVLTRIASEDEGDADLNEWGPAAVARAAITEGGHE